MMQIHHMAPGPAAQQEAPKVHYSAPASAARQETPKVHCTARVPAGTPGVQATESTADLFGLRGVVTRAREACRELFWGPRDADESQGQSVGVVYHRAVREQARGADDLADGS